MIIIFKGFLLRFYFLFTQRLMHFICIRINKNIENLKMCSRDVWFSPFSSISSKITDPSFNILLNKSVKHYFFIEFVSVYFLLIGKIRYSEFRVPYLQTTKCFPSENNIIFKGYLNKIVHFHSENWRVLLWLHQTDLIFRDFSLLLHRV